MSEHEPHGAPPVHPTDEQVEPDDRPLDEGDLERVSGGSRRRDFDHVGNYNFKGAAGGVSGVATGDITGDGIPDIITGAGPGNK